MGNTTWIWEEKEFQSRKGYAGRVVRGKDHQCASRQWNNNEDNNNDHLYSHPESAKNVYTPFGLEKVNVWVG